MKTLYTEMSDTTRQSYATWAQSQLDAIGAFLDDNAFTELRKVMEQVGKLAVTMFENPFMTTCSESCFEEVSTMCKQALLQVVRAGRVSAEVGACLAAGIVDAQLRLGAVIRITSDNPNLRLHIEERQAARVAALTDKAADVPWQVVLDGALAVAGKLMPALNTDNVRTAIVDRVSAFTTGKTMVELRNQILRMRLGMEIPHDTGTPKDAMSDVMQNAFHSSDPEVVEAAQLTMLVVNYLDSDLLIGQLKGGYMFDMFSNMSGDALFAGELRVAASSAFDVMDTMQRHCGIQGTVVYPEPQFLDYEIMKEAAETLQSVAEQAGGTLQCVIARGAEAAQRIREALENGASAEEVHKIAEESAGQSK